MHPHPAGPLTVLAGGGEGAPKCWKTMLSWGALEMVQNLKGHAQESWQQVSEHPYASSFL